MSEEEVRIRELDLEERDVPVTAPSSYQVLMEGLCEVRAKAPDQTVTLCITELLRDLYAKHYSLVKIVATLAGSGVEVGKKQD